MIDKKRIMDKFGKSLWGDYPNYWNKDDWEIYKKTDNVDLKLALERLAELNKMSHYRCPW